ALVVRQALRRLRALPGSLLLDVEPGALVSETPRLRPVAEPGDPSRRLLLGKVRSGSRQAVGHLPVPGPSPVGRDLEIGDLTAQRGRLHQAEARRLDLHPGALRLLASLLGVVTGGASHTSRTRELVETLGQGPDSLLSLQPRGRGGMCGGIEPGQQRVELSPAFEWACQLAGTLLPLPEPTLELPG